MFDRSIGQIERHGKVVQRENSAKDSRREDLKEVDKEEEAAKDNR